MARSKCQQASNFDPLVRIARLSTLKGSTALLYTPHADWTLAFDIGANRNPDREGPRTQSYALLGGIYHLNKDVDLDLGYRRSL